MTAPKGDVPVEFEEVCGETYDHEFDAPEFVDGMAVLVCRRCGGEIFEEEDEWTTP